MKKYVITLGIMLSFSCYAAHQQVAERNLPDMSLFQEEVNDLIKKFEWNTTVPSLTIIYKPEAKGGQINCTRKEIAVGCPFLELPKECQRFVLAHEIAHYHQTTTSRLSPAFEFLTRTIQRIGLVLPSAALYIKFAQYCNQKSTSRLTTDIKDAALGISSLITVSASCFYLRKQYDQIKELSADKRAIMALKDTQGGIDSFRIAERAEQIFFQFFSKSNILHKFIEKGKNFLFNTHPTDNERKNYIIALQKQYNFQSKPLLSEEVINQYAVKKVKAVFRDVLNEIQNELSPEQLQARQVYIDQLLNNALKAIST